MNISLTGQADGLSSGTMQQAASRGQKPADEKSFKEIFEHAFDSVNRDRMTADAMINRMASGADVDIAETMIAISKSDISFRMLLQVRNKALSAYEEIMRMQV